MSLTLHKTRNLKAAVANDKASILTTLKDN